MTHAADDQLARDVELIVTCDQPYSTTLEPNVIERMRSDIPEVDAAVTAEWNEYAAAQRAAGRAGHLVNTPLFRYESCGYGKNCLRLTLSQTDYREVYGTNIQNPSLRQRYGDDAMGNALGICAAIRTKDESYILFQRSPDVLELPGFFHLCAGHFERGKRSVDESPNAQAAIIQEIREELRLESSEIGPIGILGVCRSLRSFKPELLFAVDTTLTAAELTAFGRLNFEHKKLFVVDAEEAKSFLRVHWNHFVPAGKAALLLRLVLDYGVPMADGLPVLPHSSG